MQPDNSADDNLHWLSFQKGDEKAYALLFELYFKKLYQYGLHFHSDPSLVKDCIQELFIKIWRTKENLGQPISIWRYLSQSLKRIIIKEIAKKKYKNTASLAEDYYFGVVLSHDLQLIDAQISEDKLKLLEQALKKLTKRQRDAIHLKFYGNLSYEEIADIMNLSVRSVYNLISKALKALYQQIRQPKEFGITMLFLAFPFIDCSCLCLPYL